MLVGASVREVGDARPFDIVLLGADGLPVYGFNPTRPAGADLTSVPQSVTSVVLLAANAARHGAIIVNAGTKDLLVAFAATATLSAFSFVLAVNASYELPKAGYTGAISGIWKGAGAGAAKVTEITE